ncbi:eCIS core domain-containing protein [Denitromonas iodatirespirans]|uniref:DUF4157 domain-containing protein n=1 Tax=Denitromonas iodatirespirans TaxID=2795389 RepID=A0A944H9U4_DENI1|nr:DUF4157 domain-containing protein [Denitromonas iodatirespirans]MBT0959887.1 DUF4157 domain-containing protein [Denitromonas iodatirespirans]
MSHSAVLSPVAAATPDTVDGVLQRKCACGNPASATGETCEDCQRLTGLGLQPKLRIGRPDDPLENEADRLAEAVMRGPVHRHGIGAPARPPRVQRRATGGGDTEGVPPGVHEVLSASGRPLDPSLRRFFEPRFGRDFGDVRIHTDARADASAQAVGARAYTVGRHVAFAGGQYAPGTSVGQRLLAHELAHVVQQGGDARTGMLRRAPAQSPVPGGVPGGVPGAPGGALAPALPPGASHVPATAAPTPATATASAVCPACACSTEHASRIDAGRLKAKAVLDTAATLLAAPTKAIERQFEDTFGPGSNDAKRLTETADRYRAAAQFLGQSTVSNPPGSGNVHCDPTNSTNLCKTGASAHYGQGHIVVCSGNPASAQMLNPPKVAPVYRTEGEMGSPEGIRQVPDAGATQASQAASDAAFATRVTAVMAHEAIHHVVQPGVVDVYTNERLFQFLGAGSKKLDVDLSPLALQNPDSLVLFAFRGFVSDAGAGALPGAEEAMAHSEKLSGKLSVRPLLGRRRARLSVSLAEEAIAQAEERLTVLLSEIQSVQGGSSQWTLFPTLSQQLVTSLTTLGKETDFGQPDAAALARLQTIVDAFTRLSAAIGSKKVVLGRRFLQDKPDKRIEVAIPDWRAFRKLSPGAQLPILLGALLREEPAIAGLDAFVLDLAKTRGGMGKL